jgi:hypothetical protein
MRREQTGPAGKATPQESSAFQNVASGSIFFNGGSDNSVCALTSARLHAKPGADAGHRLGRRDFYRFPRCMSLIQHMFILNDGISPGKRADGQETSHCLRLLPRLRGGRCNGEKARSKWKRGAKSVMIQAAFLLHALFRSLTGVHIPPRALKAPL